MSIKNVFFLKVNIVKKFCSLNVFFCDTDFNLQFNGFLIFLNTYFLKLSYYTNTPYVIMQPKKWFKQIK